MKLVDICLALTFIGAPAWADGVRVIDGSAVDIESTRRGQATKTERYRIFGLDCAASDTSDGKGAKAVLEALLYGRDFSLIPISEFERNLEARRMIERLNREIAVVDAELKAAHEARKSRKESEPVLKRRVALGDQARPLRKPISPPPRDDDGRIIVRILLPFDAAKWMIAHGVCRELCRDSLNYYGTCGAADR